MYCGRACQIRASTAARTERRRIRREALAVTPDIPDVPVMPWRIAEAGLCGDPRTVAKVGYPWTDPAGRSLAKAVCKQCPMSIPCGEWAVASLPATDTSVYGGMTGSSATASAASGGGPHPLRGSRKRHPAKRRPRERTAALAGLTAPPRYGHIGGRMRGSAAIVAAGRPGAYRWLHRANALAQESP